MGPGALGDAPDLGDIGVECGHPLEGGSGETVALEVGQVGNLVDEDVDVMGEIDQSVVRRGVTGMTFKW